MLIAMISLACEWTSTPILPRLGSEFKGSAENQLHNDDGLSSQLRDAQEQVASLSRLFSNAFHTLIAVTSGSVSRPSPNNRRRGGGQRREGDFEIDGLDAIQQVKR